MQKLKKLGKMVSWYYYNNIFKGLQDCSSTVDKGKEDIFEMFQS